MKKNSCRGFTLIELLITIVIIGILSMIGISQFQTAQKKGRDFNRKAGLHAVAKALESYMNDKGVYPPSSEGKILWCGDVGSPTPCSWGASFIDIASPPGEETIYMAVLPKDVAGNQTYFYEAVDMDGSGLYKGYRLYAHLENAQDPDLTLYGPNCSTSPSISLSCNYVVTSETVNPLTAAPSSTSTPLPTSSSTPSPTEGACLSDGGSCTVGQGVPCCTTCVVEYEDAQGKHGTCGGGVFF